LPSLKPRRKQAKAWQAGAKNRTLLGMQGRMILTTPKFDNTKE
jgi:hypothetical protein